jgi:benzoate transport
MSDMQLRTMIKSWPMSSYQIGIVTICCLITALDGFDVLVVAFTASSLVKEWNVGPAAIGTLMSAGLIGMGLGALLLSPLGDWVGRRKAIMLCLLIMAIGMFLAGQSAGPWEMFLWRVVTGVGIGACLSNGNIVVSEYSNANSRDLTNSCYAAGYQLGATFGGMISIAIMRSFGWHEVFYGGGVIGLILVAVVYFWLPESLDFLQLPRPANALEQVNRTLRSMGQKEFAELPPYVSPAASGNKPKVSALFRDGRAGPTIAACAAYLLMMMTVYFFVSWSPRIITQMGLGAENGILSVVLMNTAGAIACFVFGGLAKYVGIRRLAMIVMFLFALSGVWYGFATASVTSMLVAATIVGYFLASSITSMYGVTPYVFPLAIRTTGVGLAMSFGRVGAALGPIVAGSLMAGGAERWQYCLVLAIPVALAGIALHWATPIAEETQAAPQQGKIVAAAEARKS